MGCHPGRNEFRPGAQSRAPVPQSDARRASGNAFVSCPPTRWSINDLLGVELSHPRFPRSDGPCRKRMETFKQRRWVSAFSFVNPWPAAAEAFLHPFPVQQSLLFLGSVVWTRRFFWVFAPVDDRHGRWFVSRSQRLSRSFPFFLSPRYFPVPTSTWGHPTVNRI